MHSDKENERKIERNFLVLTGKNWHEICFKAKNEGDILAENRQIMADNARKWVVLRYFNSNSGLLSKRP